MSSSNYGMVWPSFWDSRTGRALVADARQGRKDPLILALYLMTTKHANMLGCFALPMLYACHDTGMTGNEAGAAMTRLQAIDFVLWDEGVEFVWVKEMARVRLNLRDDDPLSQKDNRVVAVQRIYEALPSQLLVDAIHARYAKVLRLKMRTLNGAHHGPPSKGVTDPLGKGVAKGVGKVKTAQAVQYSTDSTYSTEERTKTKHPRHVFCGNRYCVPQFLHEEFTGQIGGANIALFPWYLAKDGELGNKPCTADPLQFWKRLFQREIVPKLRVAGAVDLLPTTGGRANSPVDKANMRHRAASRTAPVMKRFAKGESNGKTKGSTEEGS